MSGLRLLGRRCDAEVFEEIRPDAQCGRCSGWGPIEVQCTRDARCALCSGEHRTDNTNAQLKGALWARAKRAPTAWPSAQLPGPARGAVKPVPKEEARQAAKGWRSPPPPPRRREDAEAPSPPDSPPPEAAAAADEMEVEKLTLSQDEVCRMGSGGLGARGGDGGAEGPRGQIEVEDFLCLFLCDFVRRLGKKEVRACYNGKVPRGYAVDCRTGTGSCVELHCASAMLRYLRSAWRGKSRPR